jgi:hypothetical protein
MSVIEHDVRLAGLRRKQHAERRRPRPGDVLVERLGAGVESSEVAQPTSAAQLGVEQLRV